VRRRRIVPTPPSIVFGPVDPLRAAKQSFGFLFCGAGGTGGARLVDDGS
jgi:hypothetical protein